MFGWAGPDSTVRQRRSGDEYEAAVGRQLINAPPKILITPPASTLFGALRSRRVRVGRGGLRDVKKQGFSEGDGFMWSRKLVAAAVLGLGFGIIGCHQNDKPPRSPGEKTEMQGKMISDAGAMRQKGEQMVVDGQGKRARGQQLIAQGKNDEGQPLVADGDADVRRGQEMIRQAEQMKVNAMQMPVTTRPSDSSGR